MRHFSKQLNKAVSKEKLLEEMEKNLSKSGKVDPPLPSQFFHVGRTKRLGEGERRLMVAILKDALECYVKNVDNRTVYGKRIFGETEGWFLQDDINYLYSFRSICLWLDFDHRLIRKKLEQIKRETLNNQN